MVNDKLIHGLTIEEWKNNINDYIRVKDIKIKVCRYCGAFFLDGKWVSDSIDTLIRRILANKINKILEIEHPFMFKSYKIKNIEVDDKISIDIEVVVRLDKEYFIATKRLTLELVQTICPRCFAKKVKTHDTVVQVRGQEKLTHSDRERIYNIIRELPWSVRNEIVDIKTTKNGIDILLNDKGLGRYIARIFERELGANVTESYKLISRKPDGKTKSKLSISVRIPPSSKFFVQDKRNHLLFVYGLSGNGFLAYDFDMRKHLVIPFKTYWQWKRKIPNISWRTMRVIGLGKDNKLILLDENDYTTYQGESILNEKFFRDEQVNVLEYKGKIYVIKTETLERGLRNGEEKEEKKN